MATKTLNTRIQLKYDSYENWLKCDKDLLAGEIAIAYLGPTKSETTPSPDNGSHPVLFKVGPGKFANLPWASALAADVYDWAKAATKPEYQASEIKGLDEYIAGEIQDTDLDTRYSFEVTTDGKLKVSKTLYTLGVAGIPEEVGQYDFVTPEELAATLANYYTKSEVEGLIKVETDARKAHIGDIAEDKTVKAYVDEADAAVLAAAKEHANGIDTGVHSVSLATGTNDKTLKLTVDGNVTDNIEVKNIYSKTEVDNLVQGAKDYADQNDANETFEIKHEGGLIKLIGSNGTNSSFSDADFIKDGMLTGVTYDDKTNELVFVWNTDAGISETRVEIKDLIDTINGTDGTTVKVSTNGNTISAEVKDGSLKDSHIASDAAIAKGKLASDVQTSLGKADSAVQPAALNDYYTKNEANNAFMDATETGNAIDAKITALDLANTYQPKGDYQPAGNYKTVQEAVAVKGAENKTLKVSQDTNGVITTEEVEIKIAEGQVTGLTGRIDAKANDADLAAIAKTGNVNDLVQTDGDVLIFNCGSSSLVF